MEKVVYVKLSYSDLIEAIEEYCAGHGFGVVYEDNRPKHVDFDLSGSDCVCTVMVHDRVNG
jgi:hypothetical protein